jgi:hypothetical protein
MSRPRGEGDVLISGHHHTLSLTEALLGSLRPEVADHVPCRVVVQIDPTPRA